MPRKRRDAQTLSIRHFDGVSSRNTLFSPSESGPSFDRALAVFIECSREQPELQSHVHAGVVDEDVAGEIQEICSEYWRDKLWSKRVIPSAHRATLKGVFSKAKKLHEAIVAAGPMPTRILDYLGGKEAYQEMRDGIKILADFADMRDPTSREIEEASLLPRDNADPHQPLQLHPALPPRRSTRVGSKGKEAERQAILSLEQLWLRLAPRIGTRYIDPKGDEFAGVGANFILRLVHAIDASVQKETVASVLKKSPRSTP